MIIFGIDPGATTGIAIIEASNGKVRVEEHHQLPPKEAMLWLRRDLDQADIVGVEKYVITGRTARLSQQTDALEIIGCVKANLLYLLTDRGLDIPLSMQTPADAKTVWSDERLRKHDLHRLCTGHARDALRHALLAAERVAHHSIVL
jgi:hypothetical protein